MHPLNSCRFTRIRATALTAAVIGIAMVIGSANAGVTVGAGVDAQIQGKSTSVFTLGYLTEQRYPWEFAVGRFSARTYRNEPGGTPGTYYFAVSKRVNWHHFFGSFGLVYDTENNKVLSGHYQAQTALGYTFGRVSLSVRHISNGSTGGSNHGETFALLEYGF